MNKKRQSKVVGVELIAGSDLHKPEKPGWSADNTAKQPGNQMKIQQQNEEHGQMKIDMKNETQKPHWRFSQAKYLSWEFLTFDLKK